MLDYRKSGREDTFYGVLVDPHNLDTEYQRIELGDECVLNSNYYTDEKVSGSFTPFNFPNYNNKLLRIYYETTLNGVTDKIKLETMFLRRRDTTFASGAKSREVELHSTLWRHMNDYNYASLVCGAGANALEQIKTFVSSGGGIMNVASGVAAKKYKQTTIHKPGVQRLKVFNYMADYLGCGTLDVDPHGVLQLTPYREPIARPIVWTFEDDVNCMFEDELIVSSEEDDIPDAIYVSTTQNKNESFFIKRLPETSPYSFEQRGRHNIAYYDHSTLAPALGWCGVLKNSKLYASDDTSSSVLVNMTKGQYVNVRNTDGGLIYVSWNDTYGYTEASNLDNKSACEKKANEYYSQILSMAISIEISHYYAPIRHGDAVRFKRAETGTNVVGIVHAMDRELKPGVPTKTVLNIVNGALGNVYP